MKANAAVLVTKSSLTDEFYEHDLVPSSLDADTFDVLLNKNIIQKTKKGSRFAKSGLFLVERPILIKPWFLRSADGEDIASSKAVSAIRNLIDFVEVSSVTAREIRGMEFSCAREVLYYFSFSRLQRLVDEYFSPILSGQEVQNVGSIHGKWHVHRDLARTEMPTRFTCEFPNFERNQPIVAFLRLYAAELMLKTRSVRLRQQVERFDDLLTPLADFPQDPDRALQDAIEVSRTVPELSEFGAWIELVGHLRDFNASKFSLLDVVQVPDVEFPTDIYFEKIIEEILTKLGFKTARQHSGGVLGGSFWIDRGPAVVATGWSSRPDIYVYSPSNDKKAIILECKYKMLNESGVVSLGTGDRNQLISFLVSITGDTQFDPKHLVCIFPSAQTEDNFPSRCCFRANLNRGANVSSLRWMRNGGERLPKNAIGIDFYPINLSSAVHEFLSGTPGEELNRFKSFIRNVLASV